MISFIFFLSTAALLIQGSPSQHVFEAWNSDARIVGGSDAKSNEAVYTASMKYKKMGHVCCGIIITQRDVLTAAHCVLGRKAEDTKLQVGSRTIKSGGVLYDVVISVAHKGFNMKTARDDIGYMRSSKNIVMSASVKPISLSTIFTESGVSLTVYGWGYKTSTSFEGFPNNLQKATVKSISVADCQKAHKNSGTQGKAVFEGQVCAGGEKNIGICNGDSGCPLVSDEGKLVGIGSWGPKGCAKGLPDCYTRISFYGDWIKQQISSKI